MITRKQVNDTAAIILVISLTIVGSGLAGAGIAAFAVYSIQYCDGIPLLAIPAIASIVYWFTRDRKDKAS